MTTATIQLSEKILGRKIRRRLSEAEFCQFHEQSGEALRAYVIRVMGSIPRGEDIFQETCYRLLRTRLPEMDCSQLRSYAYRTATRLIYDTWQRSRREEPDEVAYLSESPPDCELRHDVRKLFSRLKTRQRTLLWLAYVEGCDHREIADRLGLSRASIRVLLYRARNKFSKILANEGLKMEDLIR